MTKGMTHWKNKMNHNEIIWRNVFTDLHSSHLRLKLFLISRFGSVWCLGLFWWIQPHRTPSFVSRSPADCNSSHLQKGTPQNLCLHWWRYSGHEPRVWHVPHNGQFTVYACSAKTFKRSFESEFFSSRWQCFIKTVFFLFSFEIFSKFSGV